MKTIAEEWRAFRNQTSLQSPELEAQMKLAFFVGCGACIKIMHEAFDLPEAEGRAQVAQVRSEAREFIARNLKEMEETKTKVE